MDDTETRITLRLPTGLRDRLAEAADKNARSMNGEIVFRLDEHDRLRDLLRLEEGLTASLRTELGEARSEIADLWKSLRIHADEMERKTEIMKEIDSDAAAAASDLRKNRSEVAALSEQIRELKRQNASLVEKLEAPLTQDETKELAQAIVERLREMGTFDLDRKSKAVRTMKSLRDKQKSEDDKPDE